MTVFISLAVLLLLPGYLVLLLAVPAERWPARRDGRLDPMLQVVLAVELSVAILPLVLLFTTLVGVTLTPARFAGLMAAAATGVAWRLRRLGWRPLESWRDRSIWPALGLFAGLLGVTLVLRMLQIRGLVAPAWVDGVHHTMMAQLITEQGRVPADYAPYLEIGPFIYHFGFHALAAGLVWLTGLAAPKAVLVMGQALNALVGVGVYGLTVTLLCGGAGERRSGGAEERGSGGSRAGSEVTRSKNYNLQSAICNLQWAGLVAMGVVGTVSLMPAYYVTWGRYTQLAGLVVLPAAVMLTLWWVEGGERWALALGVVAVAGLGLVHYRVLVFYGAFVAALVVYGLVGRGVEGIRSWRSEEGAGWEAGPGAAAYLVRVGVLAGLSLLLLSPWIARMARVLVTRGAWPGLEVGADYAAVPLDLLLIPRNLPLAVAAAWGLTLGLRRRHHGITLVVLWTLFLGAVAALGSPALPASVVVISLFLPEAVLIGYLVSHALAVDVAPHWHLALGAGLLAVTLWGAAGMTSVINPATVLLTSEDTAAVAWVREHTPPDARFLINSRPWQGNIYVGTDAGYWLMVLAKRETVPPPALYVLGSPDQVRAINRVSEMAASGPVHAEDLRRAGVTHVFVGARGGRIDPARLLSDPEFDLLYMNRQAWVFRLTPEAHAKQSGGASVP